MKKKMKLFLNKEKVSELTRQSQNSFFGGQTEGCTPTETGYTAAYLTCGGCDDTDFTQRTCP